MYMTKDKSTSLLLFFSYFINTFQIKTTTCLNYELLSIRSDLDLDLGLDLNLMLSSVYFIIVTKNVLIHIGKAYVYNSLHMRKQEKYFVPSKYYFVPSKYYYVPTKYYFVPSKYHFVP